MKELAISASLVLAAVTSDAAAQGVQLVERPGHVTEARVVVDASPSEIYALVTSYGNWPAIFSDVASVEVRSGDRQHARVRFRSRALGTTVTVAFDNVPGRAIRFHGIEGPPGGRADGEYDLVPLADGRTHVVARLYMDVVGAPGLFVRDARIRDMRRTKLRADMEDVARFFARKPPAILQRPGGPP
jgi:uncharacterized membrane protein